MLRQYDQIRINKVANGFIVKVACQTFVFKDWENLMSELDAWYTGNTTKFIEEYEKLYDGQPTTVDCAPRAELRESGN